MKPYKLIIFRKQLVAAMMLAAIAVPQLAIANAHKGQLIAAEVDRRDQGFINMVVKGTIINETASGAKNARDFEMTTAEVRGDGDRRLVTVSAPRSLKGTVFLTHPHANIPDDTWMILPRQKKVRRLSTRKKTSRFLGSEFTMEDISPWELRKYSYDYQGDKKCGGDICNIIQNTPTFSGSAYSRQIELINTKIFQPYQIIYYDLSGRKIKKLNFLNYTKVANKFWRPQQLKMTNLQTGNFSTINFKQYKIKQGVSAKNLVPHNLINLVSR